MSQEKYYRYFKVAGLEARGAVVDYAAIGEKRKELIDAARASVGAVLHTEARDWGGSSRVAEFVFNADFAFPCPVKIVRREKVEERDVVIVKGFGRDKGTKEYFARLSKSIRDLNEQLKDYPKFQDYLIKRYDVGCTGLGGPNSSGRGTAMLFSRCGTSAHSDEVLLFAIPTNANGCRQPEIPSSFVEITYGQFYDLTNTEVVS